MKIDLRDRELLTALAPLEVAAYLRSRGWHEQTALSPDSAAFTYGDDYEVSLPLSTALRDFPNRMFDALKTLEIVENRGQLEIFADLKASAADVIRVRLMDADAGDGSLPLQRAAEVVSCSFDMMFAAACAAVDPKYYFASRKPQLAADYMRNVRMGQTERGSFVVTILSHVTPALSGSVAAGSEDMPAPFERKVTQRLADALAALNESAKVAVATGDISPFEASVAHGVSANLCDALAGMSGADGTERDVEVSLAWARVRPTKQGPLLRYRVGRDIVPVLREVARVFKSWAPQEDFEVRGPVFRLVRDPPGAADGEVTIAGFVDGAARSIWVHLEAHNYLLAADAFKNQRLVSVAGVLRKEGRRYRLHSPKDFQVLPADED
jgi:hypothetical protein